METYVKPHYRGRTLPPRDQRIFIYHRGDADVITIIREKTATTYVAKPQAVYHFKNIYDYLEYIELTKSSATEIHPKIINYIPKQ